jgi:hypothetical protein
MRFAQLLGLGFLASCSGNSTTHTCPETTVDGVTEYVVPTGSCMQCNESDDWYCSTDIVGDTVIASEAFASCPDDSGITVCDNGGTTCVECASGGAGHIIQCGGLGSATETSVYCGWSPLPTCSDTQVCATTSGGQACLQTCPGANMGGCSGGKVCTPAAACCGGPGACIEPEVFVCCPASGC